MGKRKQLSLKFPPSHHTYFDSGLLDLWSITRLTTEDHIAKYAHYATSNIHYVALELASGVWAYIPLIPFLYYIHITSPFLIFTLN